MIGSWMLWQFGWGLVPKAARKSDLGGRRDRGGKKGWANDQVAAYYYYDDYYYYNTYYIYTKYKSPRCPRCEIAEAVSGRKWMKDSLRIVLLMMLPWMHLKF